MKKMSKNSIQTSPKMKWVSVKVIVIAAHAQEVNKYWNWKVFNTYIKLFYSSFNQNNIAFMIINVYSNIIESEKVAYHWKTGQKPTFFPATCPKCKFDAPNEWV